MKRKKISPEMRRKKFSPETRRRIPAKTLSSPLLLPLRGEPRKKPEIYFHWYNSVVITTILFMCGWWSSIIAMYILFTFSWPVRTSPIGLPWWSSSGKIWLFVAAPGLCLQRCRLKKRIGENFLFSFLQKEYSGWWVSLSVFETMPWQRRQG